MSEPIDLNAAQALVDAATPGPWAFNGSEFRAPSPYNGFMLVRAACRDADLEFIAQARSLVPELIAELREVRSRLAESDERNSNLFDLGNRHLDTIDRVKAVISDIRHWGLPRDASIRFADDLDIAIAGEQ